MKRLTSLESSHVRLNKIGNVVGVVARKGGGVWRDNDVLERPQRRAVRQGFSFEHVEGGSCNLVGLEGCNEGIGVDDGTASDVDHVSVIGNRFELGRRKQVVGVVVQRNRDNDELNIGDSRL